MKGTLKGFIIGFVTASLLVGGATSAVNQYVLIPATYPVVVDGQELSDPDYPTLNYQGTTYLSLRKTAEAVKAELTWNEEKKQAEINSKGVGKMQYFQKIKSDVIETEAYSIELFTIEGEQYVSLGVFGQYLVAEGENELYIQLPGKEPVKVRTSERKATEHSYMDGDGRINPKLSSLGLSAEVQGDTIVINKIKTK